MAGNTINFELKLNSNIKQKTQEARELNREVSAAARAAQVVDYGRARGSMGATGASARDFANQAQGLGGLVQLYATYAANVFALGAAFRALSDAMNINNMIEGLNQLGAQGGNALGSLAKQFVATSGGALSMREGIEAVSKASSAGLSNKQILEVSASATKASQVLGLALPDAVNRLTRGIVKLEPELLDELGLFTKIGPAVEEYARKLGRTESSLSDFERRQAFAIAVLKEAQDKFGKINIPTNPYDKLLATLKDISVVGLQLINTVLGPLVKFLSESPTALVVLLGLLGKNLLGRVVPIIGQYNKALETSANKAVENYTKISDIANANEKKRIAGIASRAVFEKEKIEDIKNKELEALENVSRKRLDRRTREILDRSKTEGIAAVTAKDIAYLESKKPAIYGDVAKKLVQLKGLNQEILDIEKKSVELQQKKPGLLTAAGVATARAETARRTAEGRLTVQEVSKTAQEVGLGAATKKAITDISDKRLGVVAGTLTAIGSAGVIAAEGVSRLGAVFSRFLGWIGLLVSAYQLLDMALSTNDKEVAALNESLTNLEETTKTAAATAKLFKNELSVQSIVAKANALDGLSTSISKVVKDLEAADDAASLWNKTIDSILVIAGQDLKTKFVQKFAPAIAESLGTISDPELKERAEKGFKELLNIDPKAVLNVKVVAEALRELAPKDLRKSAKDIELAIGAINEASKKAAQPLQTLKEELQTLDKSFQELTNTFIAQDPFTRYALNLNKVANTMLNAFENATNQAALLSDIAKDPSILRSLPVATQEAAKQTLKQLQELQDAIKTGEDLQRTGRLARLSAPKSDFITGQELEAEYQGSKIIQAAKEQMREVREAFKQALIIAANQSVKVIEDGVTANAKRLTVDLQKSILNYLPKTSEIVNILADLEKQGINIRKEELVRLRELAISTDKLRITNQLLLLEEEETKLAPGYMETDVQNRLANIQRSKVDLRQQLQAYTDPEGLVSQSQDRVSQGAQNILGNTAEFRTALARLNNETILVELKRVVDISQVQFDKQVEDAGRQVENYRVQTEDYLDILKASGATPQAIEDERARRQAQQKQLERRQTELGFEREIAKFTEVRNFAQQQSVGLKDKELEIYTNIIDNANKEIERQRQLQKERLANLAATDGIADREARRANEISKELRALDRVQEIETQRAQKIQQSYDTDIQRTQQALQDLDVRKDLLKLTDQEYINEKNVLDLRLLKFEAEKKVFELQTTAADKQRDLQRQIASLGGGDAERRQQLEQDQKTYEAYYAALIKGELEVYNARLKNAQAQQQLSERQKAYDKIFENSFNSLADAMVNWAETGKWAGKDLFKSLTAELLKFELRAQTSQLYSAAIRPGLLSLFKPSFNNQPGVPTTTPDFEGAGFFLNQAKGGAFDLGIKTYAKGGMFTNSIVNQPTLFKFARGTGLMGEAGPEAIMPLKRDSQGNLGVRSTGQKTEVVINNYSGERAEAKETVDSRGNRKVEVVIGEAAALDLSTAGSSSQKSLRSTFGLAPQLIRR
jgi:lambda family phage tail tape measure protein